MAQSLSKVYLHTVFCTKGRKPFLDANIRPHLFAYIGGIIKNLGAYPIVINGVEDHVHILSTFPRTITIARFVQFIKKDSSYWIKHTDAHYQSFAWQNGYATFSVSASGVAAVKKYIERQEEHHKEIAFQKEVIAFLEEYGVDYDEKYLWD